jgi:hypothetical protein
MNPFVSVVIPAYNCAPYLQRALDSIAAQHDPRLEVVAVDDGSTDETAEVLARYPEVRVHRQANAGVAAARNQAIALARGEWIAFLDADDVWRPHRLAFARLAAERAQAALVFSSFALVDRDGACLAPDAIASYYRVFSRYGWKRQQILPRIGALTVEGATADLFAGPGFPWLFRGNFIKTSTVLVRRDVVVKLGKFDPSLSTEEDYDLWLRIAMDHTIAYLDVPLVDVRRRPDQLTSAENALTVASNSVEVVRRALARATVGLEPETARRRLADVNRSLARTALITGEHTMARRAMRESIRHGGLDAAAAALWAWSFLPGRFTLGLGRAWRNGRRILAS